MKYVSDFQRLTYVRVLMFSGQELTCHYRYDMRDALKIPELQWYVEQWDRLTERVFEARKCDENCDGGVDRNHTYADTLPEASLTKEGFINEIIDGVIENVMNWVRS